MRRWPGFRMLARWPEEPIQDCTASLLCVWPIAMFSANIRGCGPGRRCGSSSSLFSRGGHQLLVDLQRRQSVAGALLVGVGDDIRFHVGQRHAVDDSLRGFGRRRRLRARSSVGPAGRFPLPFGLGIFLSLRFGVFSRFFVRPRLRFRFRRLGFSQRKAPTRRATS